MRIFEFEMNGELDFNIEFESFDIRFATKISNSCRPSCRVYCPLLGKPCRYAICLLNWILLDMPNLGWLTKIRSLQIMQYIIGKLRVIRNET